MSDTPDLPSRLREAATAWAMEQTLNGIPAEPERSYVWEAAEAIEQLQRARDEFHEDNEVLRLRCERLERELRLAESARDYANDMLDRAKSRANYTREIYQERMRFRAALERIAATDAEHPLALLMVWQIAREALAAPAPATPGPTLTTEASVSLPAEALGSGELLSENQTEPERAPDAHPMPSPEPVTGSPSEAEAPRHGVPAETLHYFMHKDGCEMREWSNPKDHVLTYFGFVVSGDECTCGAIAMALKLDPTAAARVQE